MPEQPMTAVDRNADQPAGFYGKIPSTGDFVNRRLSQQTIFVWDSWLRHSLYETRQTQLAVEGSASMHRATIWNFILPAAICGVSLIGMIAPSSDRVGRQFPFTMFKPMTGTSGALLRLVEIGRFFDTHWAIINSIRHRKLSISQLELTLEESCAYASLTPSSFPADVTTKTIARDIHVEPVGASESINADRSAIEGRSTMPWPALVLSNVAIGNTSYWWSHPANAGPMTAFTHTGGLNQPLFNSLFSSRMR